MNLTPAQPAASVIAAPLCGTGFGLIAMVTAPTAFCVGGAGGAVGAGPGCVGGVDVVGVGEVGDESLQPALIRNTLAATARQMRVANGETFLVSSPEW